MVGAAQTQTEQHGHLPKCYEVVEEWRTGTLDTLKMLGESDILAVKYASYLPTWHLLSVIRLMGVQANRAGPIAIEEMESRAPFLPILATALDEICTEAQLKGCRLWLDAEQQRLQPGLDNWAIELMRRHNKSATPLIYNTIQVYLKNSQNNVEQHIAAVRGEGWSLGVKLVRGAYIKHENRDFIHDTKADTDRSYDGIAEQLLCLHPGEQVSLFLATHNAKSVERAVRLYRERMEKKSTVTAFECGQVQGMADELGCELIRANEDESASTTGEVRAPKTFKCLVWGTVGECMGYLHRRAVENTEAVERTTHMRDALVRETRRRFQFEVVPNFLKLKYR
ncbi:FAD-linked oxidoreductase-like protein [Aspergillus granulosus]|uniref:Proline dehydrogenase n=1 Tax=Aspergillus granulosus TaxID=176169 RepID=A0ABR4H1R4_9EURO